MTIDFYRSLQQSSDDRALQQGFEAAVHDPLWFLARQWQMGEHQGENASTPVTVAYQLRVQDIAASLAAPNDDPRVVPAEAIIESEPADWWTMGRRIRVGARLQQLVDDRSRARFIFLAPSAPYEQFSGEVDGLLLWQFRDALGLNAVDFGADAPPSRDEFGWDSAKLEYRLGFPDHDSGLAVLQHHGGAVDWYSVDARSPTEGQLQSIQNTVPAPLQYPGAPANRFWQIEDAATDIGGYAPDSAHFSTMLLVDLIYSHSDDWFLLPITAHAGSVVSIEGLVVKDSFDRDYSSSVPEYATGLSAPTDWHLFRCRGLPHGKLVLWNVGELPLESRVLERVELGIDQASNLLWAVERILDGRETTSIPRPQSEQAGQNQDLTGSTVGMNQPRNWAYAPSDSPQPYWHPYLRSETAVPSTMVQHGLANLTTRPPTAGEHAMAELLRVRDAQAAQLHSLRESSIPSNGLAVERRWMLARDTQGQPKLWIQRQRKLLTQPPARKLRFDITTAVLQPRQ